MADDAITVELGEDLAVRVRCLATAAGADVNAIVRDALVNYVEDWSDTLERLAQFDRDGVCVDAEAALRRFEGALAAAVESKD